MVISSANYCTNAEGGFPAALRDSGSETHLPTKMSTHNIDEFMQMAEKSRIPRPITKSNNKEVISDSRRVVLNSSPDVERPIKRSKPNSQIPRIDKMKDLQKALKKKHHEVRRQAKYYDESSACHSTDFEAEPHMFGNLFGDKIEMDLKIDSEMTQGLFELSESLKNMENKISLDDESKSILKEISVCLKDNGGIKIDENTIKTLKEMSENIGTKDKHITINHESFGISQFFRLIGKGLPHVIVVAVILGMIYLYTPRGGEHRVYFIGMIVLGIALYLPNIGLENTIESFFQERNEVESNSLETTDFSKLAASMFNVFMFGKSSKKLFSSGDFVKGFSEYGRATGGVGTLVDGVGVILKIVRTVIEKMFSNGTDDTFVMTGYEFIDEFLKASENFIKQDEQGSLLSNSGSVDKCGSIIRLGESVVLKIPGHADFVSIRMLINNCLSRLRKIKEKLLSSNFKYSGIRQEPVAVLFRGPPGCGKSNAMQYMADAMSALTFEKEEYDAYLKCRANFIYNRMGETEHWEGYDARKRICFFDDLGQCRDVEGNPDNEIFNIIRAINVFEYNLHMAGLEFKGNTMFRSAYILANTNLEDMKFRSIIEAGAFLRRWDIVVDVYPKEMYCENSALPLWEKKLDVSKLPLKEGTTYRHPSQLMFQVMKMSRDGKRFEPTQHHMNWETLVRCTHAQFKKKTKWHNLSIKELDNDIANWRKEHVPEDDKEKEDDAEANYNKGGNSSDGYDYHEGSDFEAECEENEVYFEAREWGVPVVEDEWEDEPPSKKEMDAPFGVTSNDINRICCEYINTMEKVFHIDTPLLEMGPHVNELHTEWKVKYPTHYVELRCVFVYIVFILGQQYRVDVPPYMLVKALREPEIEEILIKQCGGDEFNYHAAQIVITNILKMMRSGDGPKYKTFKRFINRAREEYANVRKVRKMSPWKAMVYKTWLWCKGWAKVTADPFHVFCDPEAEWFDKVAYGIVLVSRLTMAYYALKFGAWIWRKTIGGSNQKKIGGSERETSIIDPSDRDVIIDERLDKNIKKMKRRGGTIEKNGDAESHSLASESRNVMDIINSVSRRNIYHWWSPMIESIGKKDASTHENLGSCVALGGNFILLPFHFVTMLIGYSEQRKKMLGDEGGIVEIRNTLKPDIRYRCQVKDIVGHIKFSDEGDANDVCIIQFPGMQPSRDIRKLFATEAQIKKYSVIDAIVMVPKPSGVREFHNIRAEPVSQPLRVKTSVLEPYIINNYWTYANTKVSYGDCGALMYVDDKSKGSVIIGIHVAGNKASMRGFAPILSREFIDRMLGEYSDSKKAIVMDETVNDLELEIYEEGEDRRFNMEFVGSVTANMGSHSSGETKITKSPLWNTYKISTTAPAQLKKFTDVDGNVIDPMRVALNRCCRLTPLASVDKVRRAVLNLEGFLNRRSRRITPKIVFSFEEGVLGDGSPWFNAMPRVTSAGFPYTTMSGKRSKERFFGDKDDYDLKNPECEKLRLKCSEIEERAKKGIRSTHVFIDSLKDERRSFAKVSTGNTRLFSAGPTPLLILMRRYFGAYLKWITMNSIENGCCISVNPYSTDWHMIAKDLNRFGKDRRNIGAGDFKNFDMSMNPRIADLILELINRWYDGSEEDNMVRKVLWKEVTQPLHLNKRMLYYWTAGLSSGILVTALINNLINHSIFRVAHEELLVLPDISEDLFEENIELKTTGDDNIFSTDEECEEHFTEAALVPVFKELGYEYVPEDKTKSIFGNHLRYLNDVTFNKRRFVEDKISRLYVGPLDLDVVLESPMWLKDSACSIGDLEEKIDTCLCELVLHGEETFEFWCKKIMDRIQFIYGLRYPSRIDYWSIRLKLWKRGELELEDEKLTSEREENDAEGHSRLRALSNEFHDEKDSETLLCSTECRIYDYCQEALPAVLVNSRSHDFVEALAHALQRESATENSTTTMSGNESSGLIIQERDDAGGNLFLNNSTTKGTDDALVTKGIPSHYRKVEDVLYSGPRTGVKQELADFLAKPILLQSGVLATTDSVPITIYSSLVPSGILTNPIWADKLAGNYAFRGTLVLTLQINGTRFQQGRYILAWVPDGGGNNRLTNNNSNMIISHSANLVQTTQLPHVEIDVNCDTSAVLEIPLVNCVGYSPIARSTSLYQYGNGMIFLRPYSPLVAPTGSTTAGWALYAYWKDVEFQMPVVPQSSRKGKGNYVLKRRGENPQEAEMKEANIGPIEGMLMKVGTAADIIAGVPLLSSVAGPVSWVSHILANTAGSFGWSKPRYEAPPTVMTRQIIPKYNNCDSADYATRLGLFENGGIEEVPGFGGTDFDEMSISYLSTIKSYQQKFNWSESDVEGTVKATLPICPRDYIDQIFYGTNLVTFPTPMAWVSNFFSMWRGSIRFTFKIVKTEFHSGRLLVAFLPFDSNCMAVPGTPSINDTTFLHREIVDVRYGNEFSIVIPYVSLTAYRQLFGADRMTGNVYVYVLNPLVAPATVSSSVDVLIEVGAMPDMEFACPRDVQEEPTMVVYAQMGEGGTCEVVDDTIGNSAFKDDMKYSSTCMGERILSLRSLIRRYSPLISSVSGSTNAFFIMIPWALPINYITSINALVSCENTPSDIFSQISFSFALSRGSVRLKFIDSYPSDQIFMNARLLPWSQNESNAIGAKNLQYQATPISELGGIGNGSNNYSQYTNISGGLELEVPYYNRTWCHPISDACNNALVTSSVNYNSYGVAPRSMIQLTWNTNVSNLTCFRAAGEDFSVGLFISVMPYVNWTTHNS